MSNSSVADTMTMAGDGALVVGTFRIVRDDDDHRSCSSERDEGITTCVDACVMYKDSVNSSESLNGKGTEDSLDDLSENFDKKLRVNNGDNQGSVLPRGPAGGYAATKSNLLEPSPKFFKPHVVHGSPPQVIRQDRVRVVDSLGVLHHPSGLKCGFTNHSYDKQFLNSKCIQDEEGFSNMTAGEVLERQGKSDVEQTYFTTIYPNVVCDEHGQIIPQNNKRKSNVGPKSQPSLQDWSTFIENPISVVLQQGAWREMFTNRPQQHQQIHQQQVNHPLLDSKLCPIPYLANPCVQYLPQQTQENRIGINGLGIQYQTLQNQQVIQQQLQNHLSQIDRQPSNNAISLSSMNTHRSSNLISINGAASLRNPPAYFPNIIDINSHSLSYPPMVSQAELNAALNNSNIPLCQTNNVAGFCYPTPQQKVNNLNCPQAPNNACSFASNPDTLLSSDLFVSSDFLPPPSSSSRQAVPLTDQANESIGDEAYFLRSFSYEDMLTFLDGHENAIKETSLETENNLMQQTYPPKTVKCDVPCVDWLDELFGNDIDIPENLIQDYSTGHLPDYLHDLGVDLGTDGPKPSAVVPAFNTLRTGLVDFIDSPSTNSSSAHESYENEPFSVASSGYLSQTDHIPITREQSAYLQNLIPQFDVAPPLTGECRTKDFPSANFELLDELLTTPADSFDSLTITRPIVDSLETKQVLNTATLSPLSNFSGDLNHLQATITLGQEASNRQGKANEQNSNLAIEFDDDDLIAQDEDGDNILHRAVIDGDHMTLRAALLRLESKEEAKKRVIETKNELCQTPLCLAVVTNQPIMVRCLIDSGSDVDVPIMSKKDQMGTYSFTRPLHFAASRGQLWMDCMRELLANRNISVNSSNSEGKTPLHCAVKGHGTILNGRVVNSIPSVELLVEKGADLNKPDCCFDMTPLHYAITGKSFDMVSCLISLASPRYQPTIDHFKENKRYNSNAILDGSVLHKMLNARTGTGFSALHLAASLDMKSNKDKLKLIQLLLSKGADPSSKNSEGRLPRELTKDQKVVELLKGIGLWRRPSPPSN